MNQRGHSHDFTMFSSPSIIILRCLVHTEVMNFEETAEIRENKLYGLDHGPERTLQLEIYFMHDYGSDKIQQEQNISRSA